MIKKGDFIQIEYTGSVDGQIFDTTNQMIAQKAGMSNPHMHFGPIIICVGKGHVLTGLDKHIEGKEIGKSFTITLSPEEGFGKKNAKLIQLVGIHKFTKAGVMPQVGLQVNVDNMMGIIRTVTGGRVIVDFNHPLSGKELTYAINIKSKVDDLKSQVKAILELELHEHDATVTAEGKKVVATVSRKYPPELNAKITQAIKEMTGAELTLQEKKEEKAQPKEALKQDSNRQAAEPKKQVMESKKQVAEPNKQAAEPKKDSAKSKNTPDTSKKQVHAKKESNKA